MPSKTTLARKIPSLARSGAVLAGLLFYGVTGAVGPAKATFCDTPGIVYSDMLQVNLGTPGPGPVGDCITESEESPGFASTTPISIPIAYLMGRI
jgi:hypothetical protein